MNCRWTHDNLWEQIFGEKEITQSKIWAKSQNHLWRVHGFVIHGRRRPHYTHRMHKTLEGDCISQVSRECLKCCELKEDSGKRDNCAASILCRCSVHRTNVFRVCQMVDLGETYGKSTSDMFVFKKENKTHTELHQEWGEKWQHFSSCGNYLSVYSNSEWYLKMPQSTL